MSHRVQREIFSPSVDIVSSRYNPTVEWAVDRIGISKRWRIYDLTTDYTTTTGQTMQKRAVRRYDPDAGPLEGRMADFSTKELAIAYIQRWLDLPKRAKK